MKVPQSKILLPMACSALIGANLSLIGASHSLVVHSLLERVRGRGFVFFEFTIVGAVLLVAAMTYIFVLGDRLLPGAERVPEPTKVPMTVDLAKTYELEDRIYEGWVSENLAEKSYTVETLDLDEFGLTLLAPVGAGAMILLGIVSPARIYQAVDWRTLVLIGGIYPLGVALNSSGAADFHRRGAGSDSRQPGTACGPGRRGAALHVTHQAYT